MDINLMDYIVTQELILIPVLYVLGKMLKDTTQIKDWTIPWILLVASIMGSISIMGLNVNAIIQGFLCVGVTVYTNQLIKQSVKKREQD